MLRVQDLSYIHIGTTVTILPRGDESPEDFTGVIRWITLTSDSVIVALEEGESGAVEWHQDLDATVRIHRERADP